MKTLKRAQVPLTQADLEFLVAVRTAGTAEYEAVTHKIPGVDPAKSDAEALRALIEVARRALRDEAMGAGYTELAAQLSEEDHALIETVTDLYGNEILGADT